MASRRFLLQLAAPCLLGTKSRVGLLASRIGCLRHIQPSHHIPPSSVAGFHTSRSRFNEHIINIQDEEDFKTRVLSSESPVIVDFHADWCGPCKLLGPRLESVVANRSGKVIMAKVDIDENSDLAIFHGVEAVPTVLAMKNGKTVDKFVGLKEEGDLEKFVDKLTGD